MIQGAEVSTSEAAAAGAVGLWIDLTDCAICRHDVPAVCSGTLVAPRLVLSARHCIDETAELGGRLTKVVFAPSVFAAPAAASVPVERYVTSPRGDLVLIKLARDAPAEWQPQRVALDLAAALTGPGAALSDLFGGRVPLVAYGYGDAADGGAYEYSAGALRRIRVEAISKIAPAERTFYSRVVERGSGTCSGDSGGAALFGVPQARARAPGDRSEQVVVGVLSENSTPCTDSNGLFVNPDAFRDFLTTASRELGSPIEVSSKGEWIEFLSGGLPQ